MNLKICLEESRHETEILVDLKNNNNFSVAAIKTNLIEDLLSVPKLQPSGKKLKPTEKPNQAVLPEHTFRGKFVNVG